MFTLQEIFTVLSLMSTIQSGEDTFHGSPKTKAAEVGSLTFQEKNMNYMKGQVPFLKEIRRQYQNKSGYKSEFRMSAPLYGQSKTPGQNNYIPMLKSTSQKKNTQRPNHIF